MSKLFDKIKERTKDIIKEKEIKNLLNKGNKIPLQFKDELEIEVHKSGEVDVQHNSQK